MLNVLAYGADTAAGLEWLGPSLNARFDSPLEFRVVNRAVLDHARTADDALMNRNVALVLCAADDAALAHAVALGAGIGIPVIGLAHDPSPAQIQRVFALGAHDCIDPRERERLLGAAVREIAWRSERRSEGPRSDLSFTTFARCAAHDMNNYLSAVVAFASMLKRHRDRQVVEDAREILHAAGHAALLCAHVTKYGRASDAVVHNLNRSLVAVRPLLDSLVDGRAKVTWQLDKRELDVLAAPVELEQIVINLALNARDAAAEALIIRTQRIHIGVPSASPTPPASAQSSPREIVAPITPRAMAPGNYVELTVSDDGCGMDEATRIRVFEPFFTTKGDLGTGLGLATVHTIVAGIGGVVTVESHLGRGTTVKVLLPEARSLDTERRLPLQPLTSLSR